MIRDELLSKVKKNYSDDSDDFINDNDFKIPMKTRKWSRGGGRSGKKPNPYDKYRDQMIVRERSEKTHSILSTQESVCDSQEDPTYHPRAPSSSYRTLKKTVVKGSKN